MALHKTFTNNSISRKDLFNNKRINGLLFQYAVTKLDKGYQIYRLDSSLADYPNSLRFYKLEHLETRRRSRAISWCETDAVNRIHRSQNIPYTVYVTFEFTESHIAREFDKQESRKFEAAALSLNTLELACGTT